MVVEAKEKPRWYQLRWKLSNVFMRVGRWIYPENPEWKAFFVQTYMDQMLYGHSIVRIDPVTVDIPAGFDGIFKKNMKAILD